MEDNFFPDGTLATSKFHGIGSSMAFLPHVQISRLVGSCWQHVCTRVFKICFQVLKFAHAGHWLRKNFFKT